MSERMIRYGDLLVPIMVVLMVLLLLVMATTPGSKISNIALGAVLGVILSILIFSDVYKGTVNSEYKDDFFVKYLLVLGVVVLVCMVLIGVTIGLPAAVGFVLSSIVFVSWAQLAMEADLEPKDKQQPSIRERARALLANALIPLYVVVTFVVLLTLFIFNVKDGIARRSSS